MTTLFSSLVWPLSNSIHINYFNGQYLIIQLRYSYTRPIRKVPATVLPAFWPLGRVTAMLSPFFVCLHWNPAEDVLGHLIKALEIDKFNVDCVWLGSDTLIATVLLRTLSCISTIEGWSTDMENNAPWDCRWPEKGEFCGKLKDPAFQKMLPNVRSSMFKTADSWGVLAKSWIDAFSKVDFFLKSL